MFFDERGSLIVGKPAEKLIKQYTRSETPPEISALIGEKKSQLLLTLCHPKILINQIKAQHLRYLTEKKKKMP